MENCVYLHDLRSPNGKPRVGVTYQALTEYIGIVSEPDELKDGLVLGGKV